MLSLTNARHYGIARMGRMERLQALAALGIDRIMVIGASNRRRGTVPSGREIPIAAEDRALHAA